MQNFINSKGGLFLTAFLQVALVASNVTFIAYKMWISLAITGFLISFVWTLNVKRISIGSWTDRFIYSFGAMLGTICGVALSNFLKTYLNAI